MKAEQLLDKALAAPRERKTVDFKSSLDLQGSGGGDICELVKDLVAMANSGGGVILIGVADDGSPTEFDAEAFLRHDPAKLTDQLFKYTGRQFSDWEVQRVERHGKTIAAIVVADAGLPLVFSRAGTYERDGKSKVAFQNGTIYVRHGAKSEPANGDDLSTIVERRVALTRRQWMSGIRKVTTAPAGHVVYTGPVGGASGSAPAAPSPVARIVGDPGAPAVYPTNADDLWPHRSKELIALVNGRLADRAKITSHDVTAVRHVHELERVHPTLAHKAFLRSSPQYSDACVDWFVERFNSDPEFFTATRARYKDLQKGATKESATEGMGVGLPA